MSAVLLAKLALVPGVVWLASLAARRWGHSVSGYLGGLPLIGGPITLYLALDPGPAFAAQSAVVTLAAVAGQGAHLATLSAVGRRFGPWAGLLAGWTAFATTAVLVGQLPLSPLAALAVAVLSLLVALRLLPPPRGPATKPAVPPVELWLRLAAALALAAAILLGAATLGPTVSGILLSMPVTGSIMPPFTLALYGPDALARLLRGFVTGLTGFVAFFFVVSSTLSSLGVATAFVLATVAALAAIGSATALARKAARS